MKPQLQALDSSFDYPPVNIAVEEALRAGLDGTTGYLLTYVNAACVIIGRNQSPEHELASQPDSGQALPVYRRTSGGGAVFHDRGNLNWSFVVPGGLDDRAGLLAIVVDALRAKGIPASSGSRGEIMAGGYKIGGTASAAGKGILMFHGTVLVCTDLEMLQQVLAAHHPSYPGRLAADLSRRGVASIPSAVGNAAWFHPGLRPMDLSCALVETAGAAGALDWASIIDSGLVEKLAEKYASHSWIYRITQKGTP
ncbi:MAG: lipoate--protein ligase family protein [Spirochaetota bacterium]